MRNLHALSVASLAVAAAFPAFAEAEAAMAQNVLPVSAVAAYWTPERMAKAVPRDGLAPAPANAAKQTAAPGAKGAPGATLGTLPTVAGKGEPPLPRAIARPEVVLRSRTAAAPANTIIPVDGSSPGPHNTYQYAPRYRTFPISAVGKLFFTDPQTGGGFVCTGTATSATGGNLDTIWTAGHCVAEGGGSRYYANFYFCPSYDSDQGGADPAVGCWGWTAAQTTPGWFSAGSFTVDYAWIHASATGSVLNTHLVSAVGGLGLAWNQPRDQAWQHYGYPAGSPYTGGKIIATTTEHRYDDSDADTYGPATNAWGSSQNGGSSGSAVLLNFSYSGASINSNVSFTYTSPTNDSGLMLHGPYYDTNACNFWKAGTGFSGTC